jgi:hypothetical protein
MTSRALIGSALSLLSLNATAAAWCDLPPGGYDLYTHGTMSNQVYLVGQLPGAPAIIWITIADDTVGKSNVALILAAQLAGKGISLYLDAPTATCANYPSWAPIGGIRHIRILP